MGSGTIVVPVAPPKKSGGWKSKLGAILKGFFGVALGYFVENVLPGLVTGGQNTQGLGMALGGLVAADAFKDYGMADKQDKNTAAVEENTAAVKRIV